MRYAESHRNKLKHARDALNDMLVPTSIKANFRCLSKEAERQLSESITKNYLSSNYFPSGYAETEVGRNDLSDHLYVRLREHRSTIIPWLNTLRPLKGSEILEIGCGTGTSTVALAEQGARVTAVEVDARSLRVAKERCHLYGLETVTFHDMNAQDVGRQPLDNFDFAIFFACIEHMTLEEKLTSISTVWNGLKAGSHLIVTHTPNRLWWEDLHTSWLPFFNWLPDDLAAHYSKCSRRTPFNSEFRPPLEDYEKLKFARVGRAASYHEFELAIPDLKSTSVSCQNAWIRNRNPFQYAKWIVNGDRRFQKMIKRLGPKLPDAFYSMDLTFSVEKT